MNRLTPPIILSIGFCLATIILAGNKINGANIRADQAESSQMIAEDSELVWKEKSERLEAELIEMIHKANQIGEWEIEGVPLSRELQEYTINTCLEHDLNPIILFRLMHRESRFQEDAIGYNRNGTQDHGICQLNDVSLPFLLERGIDPTESPQENIRAAVYLITYYRDERGHSLEESLACYGEGEVGMLAGRGFEAAIKLLEGVDR